MKMKLDRLALVLRIWAFLSLAAAVLLGNQDLFAAGTWTALSQKAPGNVGLMLLLPDGTVMVANPSDSFLGDKRDEWYRLTPDSSGHYVNGTWTSLSKSAYTRLYFASQVLQDGRVFVAGGEYGTGGTNAAEIYDPVSDKWNTLTVPAGLVNTTIRGLSDCASVLLPNGSVMIAPVVAATRHHTIIYDPSANSWSDGPAILKSQNETSWVKLSDDSILTVDEGATSSERFIPSLNTWVKDANLPANIYGTSNELGAAFLLPDGRAFFIGGTNRTALYTPSPLGGTNTGTWVLGPTIPNNSGAPDAGACMMINGKILCALSPVGNTNDAFPTPVSFYEYDYTVGTTGYITPTGAPTRGTDNIPAYKAFMLALPDGNVLYSDNHKQLYVYQPSGAAIAAGKPTISSVYWRGDGNLHVMGTKFNGISSGAAYGDDAQMDSNYPLVRFTSGGIVTYGRTFDWSSTGVATGTEPVSTDCYPTPAYYTDGPNTLFSLSVVANGNASSGVSFYGPVWVDFDYAGFALRYGDYNHPWNTLAKGVSDVTTGGTIALKASHRYEPITISNAMTIVSIGGSTVIGQ